MPPDLTLPRDPVRRRRLAVLGGAIVVLVVVLAIVIARAVGGSGSGPAIEEGSLRLVPAGALVEVHVSTDPRRAAVRRALALAQGFPSYERLRDRLLRGLAVGGSSGQIGDWIGRDATLALLDSRTGTAGSLLVLGVRDMDKARAFVRRGAKGGAAATRYRGVALQPYGATTAAFVGSYLVLGQPQTVREAIDAAQGRARGLASDRGFVAAMRGLPADRVLDAYATADGVHRVLAPAGGVLGVAGTLLDRPGLRSTAVSLSARSPGALVQIHSVASPGGPATFGPFSPKLLDAVPAGVIAYLGVRHVDRAIDRLLAAAPSSGVAAGIAALVRGAEQTLGRAGSAQVRRDLLAPLRDEGAVFITEHSPAPVLTLMARAPDETRSRAALARLADSLRGALRGASVTHSQVAGTEVTTLRVGGALELDAAVFDGKLVVSTNRAGIAAVRAKKASLADSRPFRFVLDLGNRRISAVVFLDFNRLLTFGELVGLNDSAAYRAARADLVRVRSVGLQSTGHGGDTTTLLRLEIP